MNNKFSIIDIILYGLVTPDSTYAFLSRNIFRISICSFEKGMCLSFVFDIWSIFGQYLSIFVKVRTYLLYGTAYCSCRSYMVYYISFVVDPIAIGLLVDCFWPRWIPLHHQAILFPVHVPNGTSRTWEWSPPKKKIQYMAQTALHGPGSDPPPQQIFFPYMSQTKP